MDLIGEYPSRVAAEGLTCIRRPGFRRGAGHASWAGSMCSTQIGRWGRVTPTM